MPKNDYQLILTEISKGIKGICRNKSLSIYKKLIFFYDYFGFIFLYLFNKLIKKEQNRQKLYSFNLEIFFYSPQSYFFLLNEIFAKSIYENKDIQNPSIIIDAGANIGISVLWFRLKFPKAKIIAFEPDPNNLLLLEKNIKINKLKNIEIVKKAISNKSGKSIFYRINDPIQNLDSGLKLNQNLSNSQYLVNTCKLSTHINSKVDLLKMDIEGAEYDVFEELISSKKIDKINNIYFEAHYFNNIEKNIFFKLLEKLNKIGSVTTFDNSQYSCLNYYHRYKQS
jgi:FkbM family methyltransferase